MIIKEVLRQGDIILFHTRGFSPISWAIRTLTESFFNHAGMYVEDLYRNGFVIEALGRGVVRTPISKYENNRHYITKIVKVKEAAFKDNWEYRNAVYTAVKKMREAVGRSYDWWAIVYLGIVYFMKGSYKEARKHIPVGNPLQSRNRFFCSELICSAFSGTSSIVKNIFAGKKYPEADCSTITPRDISKSEWVEWCYGCRGD